MRFFIIAVFAMATVGCASPKYNYVPNMIDISDPPVGQVNTANVGEILVRQGTYAEVEAILVHEKFSGGLIGTYTFHPGYYIMVGQDDKAGYYEPEQGQEGGHVTKSAITDPYQSMQVYHKKPKVCGVSTLGGKACEGNAPISRVKRPALRANSFQQALIYSGTVGNKISIGYREFSNSMARPAFNNNVEYDLSDSNIIGYKGAQMEIIEATNQFLRYRVIRNFNQEQ